MEAENTRERSWDIWSLSFNPRK